MKTIKAFLNFDLTKLTANRAEFERLYKVQRFGWKLARLAGVRR